MNNLCQLHYFLGIEVIHTNDGLVLTQSRYALDLLRRIAMTDYKPLSTPLSTSQIFRNCEHNPLSSSSVTSYLIILCALQYLTTTRPDLTFFFSQFIITIYDSPLIIHEQLTNEYFDKGTLNFGFRILSHSSLYLYGFFIQSGLGVLILGEQFQDVACFLVLIVSFGIRKATYSCSIKAEYRSMAVVLSN